MKMRKRLWLATVCGALVTGAAGWPGTAAAAGLLIADGGFGGVLEIKEHDVQVTINNGVAVTRVTQVFHNTEKRQVEALYTFPVPKGASVANFSMWISSPSANPARPAVPRSLISASPRPPPASV